MIEQREPPTCSNSQRYGSGFHGSPVVTIVRSDVRSASGSPCGIKARTSVGESPRIETLSSSTSRHSDRTGNRCALGEDERGSERVAADHGPLAHDPAHVGREMDHVAGPRVGLVADLPRDRDEEPALDVDDALRPAGRPGRVREQVRRLGIDLGRWQDAGLLGGSSSHGARTTCSSAGASRRPSSRIASMGTSRPRRNELRVVIATLASRPEAAARQQAPRSPRRSAPGPRRDARTRARRPRPPATWAEKRDAVTNADAERRESLCEARDLIRHLGERQCASPVVLAERDACDRVGRRLRPTMGAVVGNAHLPPTNQVAHSGPRERSTTRSHGRANSSPMSSTARPRTSRDRPANGRRARGGRRCRAGASGGRRSRARALRERDARRSRPCAAKPSGRRWHILLVRANLALANRASQNPRSRHTQVVDARRSRVRPVRHHARQHGRERRAASDPGRTSRPTCRSSSGSWPATRSRSRR